MDTRDLIKQLNGYSEEFQSKWDSLAQIYVQKCKEFFEKNKDNTSYHNATFLGVPIEDFCIPDQILQIREHIWYLGGSESLRDFKHDLIPFDEYEDDDLYEGEIKSFEIAPFARALKFLGFSVYVDTGNGEVLVPFFAK